MLDVDLEKMLQNRPLKMPSAAFKKRVLASIREEVTEREAPWAGWQWAATVAAGVMIWFLPLLMHSPSRLPRGRVAMTQAEKKRVEKQFRELLPDLDEREIRRQIRLSSRFGL